MSTPPATDTGTTTSTAAGESVDLVTAVVAALGPVGSGVTVLVGEDREVLSALRARGPVVAVGSAVRAATDALPLVDDAAEALVAVHALREVEDLDAAIAGFARVVGDGGRVVIAANALAHRRELRGVWATAARDCGVVDPPPLLDIDERFPLDHARAWMQRHLADVTVTPVRGATTLDTAQVLALLRAERPDTAGVTWDLLASVAESRVRDVVAEHGGFTLSTLTGIATGVVRGA
ncbi:hypothetical protein [Actinokineospora terrae]|uniref:hypothetical protein n=1 Tax=Actinokineospora terrae TaxID=155974 RepID=UPI000B86FFE4|nr:hypothetical protein [Actinokineospora terrae]